MADLADLPTGTVTFLFTDLEGSTGPQQAHPAAYRDAVRRHHDLLRGAVEGHGGVVFETVGDAVYAAFARPTDAVRAALAGQLALQREAWGATGPLQARMGVHLGEVETYPAPGAAQGARYLGLALVRCARLMVTAHGGQVVLSEAATALVRDDLPEGAGLRDLGAHRLKDLQRPERVFQLLHPDVPGEFPPLRSLDARPHNLPLQLTSFVGRERELAAIGELLARYRLVTLTGPGGVGKTRLALQTAAGVLDAYPDGVWLSELGALADPNLVPQAVAAAAGVREEPGRPLVTTLAAALQPKRLLLVLDTCEHVLDACARLADALLRGCPDVRVLATSREALSIGGETAWRVPSLALPPARHPLPVETLSRNEAVRLFVERARTVRPDFAVTGRNAPAVAQVCAQLDGIPLALELAAARVRVLPVEQLLTRLEDRFRLLTGGSRTALDRHQTLQAAVDWSYDLLTEPEQRLFDRLSVFAGGCTLEAAEQVGAGEGLDEADVLDLLTRLVDKSLVGVDEQPDGSARYRLLETLRHYGQQRLAARGAAGAVRARHAAYFAALATRALPDLADLPAPAWHDRLDAELENLRALLRWVLDTGDVALGLGLPERLRTYWYDRDHMSEAQAWLAALLALPGAAPRSGERAGALGVAGYLHWQQGDLAAARRLLQGSLDLARELGDGARVFFASHYLGRVCLDAGALSEARACLAVASAGAAALGQPDTGVRLAMGHVARYEGQHDEARRLYEQALALYRRGVGGSAWMIAITLGHLGAAALEQGDLAAARAHTTESLALLRELGFRGHVAETLEVAAGVAAAAGQPHRAVRLAGAAAALRDRARAAQSPVEHATLARWLAPAERGLDPLARATAWVEGQAMTPEQAVADALAEEAQDDA